MVEASRSSVALFPPEWGLTAEHRSVFLGISSLLPPKEERTLLVYRNRDETIYPLPLLEFEKKLGITYLDTLLFDDPTTLHQVAKRCARKLKWKKWRQMNRWTLALHEKRMNAPREDHFYIRWINRYLGYGVYAACDLPANTYVGEYTGRIKKRNKRENRFNDYVFSYDLCGKATRWCIDAQAKGNFTRFLNHSDRPNLTSRWVIKEGITHIIFFTNTFVPAHTQMTYCYGPWYWRSRSEPASL